MWKLKLSTSEGDGDDVDDGGGGGDGMLVMVTKSINERVERTTRPRARVLKTGRQPKGGKGCSPPQIASCVA